MREERVLKYRHISNILAPIFETSNGKATKAMFSYLQVDVNNCNISYFIYKCLFGLM